MTMNEYAESRGLTISLIARQMKVSRQMLSAYGRTRNPNGTTIGRIARAMTELGAETKGEDVWKALCGAE